MKESIKIKNLGPLVDVDIDGIRPMTVLIGESGCGKSLLMKTLILFRYIYKMLNIRWYLRNSNVNKSRFKLSMSNLLTPELKSYFRNNKKIEIVYTVEMNGRKHSVIYRDGIIDKQAIASKIPNEDLLFLKESWISEMRGIIPEWAASGNMLKKRNLDFYFQETLNDFMDATDEDIDIPLNYLGVSLKVERRGDSKKFFINPLDGSYSQMEWQYGSSGVQTSSSIVSLIDYFSKRFSFKDAIGRSIISYLYENDNLRLYKPELEPMDIKKVIHIHIEEPELNLYPSAQCHLLDSMASLAFDKAKTDREVRMIMATHSPYIVNYLNVLMHQKKDGRGKISPEEIAVYRLYGGRLQQLTAIDENGVHKLIFHECL